MVITQFDKGSLTSMRVFVGWDREIVKQDGGKLKEEISEYFKLGNNIQ